MVDYNDLERFLDEDSAKNGTSAPSLFQSEDAGEALGIFSPIHTPTKELLADLEAAGASQLPNFAEALPQASNCLQSSPLSDVKQDSPPAAGSTGTNPSISPSPAGNPLSIPSNSPFHSPLPKTSNRSSLSPALPETAIHAAPSLGSLFGNSFPFPTTPASAHVGPTHTASGTLTQSNDAKWSLDGADTSIPPDESKMDVLSSRQPVPNTQERDPLGRPLMSTSNKNLGQMFADPQLLSHTVTKSMSPIASKSDKEMGRNIGLGCIHRHVTESLGSFRQNGARPSRRSRFEYAISYCVGFLSDASLRKVALDVMSQVGPQVLQEISEWASSTVEKDAQNAPNTGEYHSQEGAAPCYYDVSSPNQASGNRKATVMRRGLRRVAAARTKQASCPVRAESRNAGGRGESGDAQFNHLHASTALSHQDKDYPSPSQNDTAASNREPLHGEGLLSNIMRYSSSKSIPEQVIYRNEDIHTRPASIQREKRGLLGKRQTPVGQLKAPVKRNRTISQAPVPHRFIQKWMQTIEEKEARERAAQARAKRRLKSEFQTSLGPPAKRVATIAVSSDLDLDMNMSPAAKFIAKKRRDIAKKKVSDKKDQRDSEKTDTGLDMPPPSSIPSRFCHLCTRSTKVDVVLICRNVSKGTCRKVICFRCAEEQSWDVQKIRNDDEWTCTHCNNVRDSFLTFTFDQITQRVANLSPPLLCLFNEQNCPLKAQCHTYKRVNQHRKTITPQARKPG